MSDTIVDRGVAAPVQERAGRWQRFQDFVLSPNPGKRAAEKWLFCWFLITIPFQGLLMKTLSWAPGTSNDAILVPQGVIMGLGAWFGPLVLRAKEDKGKPFYEVYGFKLGCFLAIWAMVGGYLGTDPWYEVLHGHFAFNTSLNPNGVPLFFLPMTIAVFGFYTVVLGAMFRVSWRAIGGPRLQGLPSGAARVALIFVIACILPLGETFFYKSASYCFDDTTGMWWLNVLIYGSWQFAALLFYPKFDEEPGENQPVVHYVVTGFAAVGILMFGDQVLSEFVAPHFTNVIAGAQYVNDWSADNCLGPRPG